MKSQARYLKRRKRAKETKQYEADVMQIAKRLAYLPVILSAVLLLRNSKWAVKTKGKSSKLWDKFSACCSLLTWRCRSELRVMPFRNQCALDRMIQPQPQAIVVSLAGLWQFSNDQYHFLQLFFPPRCILQKASLNWNCGQDWWDKGRVCVCVVGKAGGFVCFSLYKKHDTTAYRVMIQPYSWSLVFLLLPNFSLKWISFRDVDLLP